MSTSPTTSSKCDVVHSMWGKKDTFFFFMNFTTASLIQNQHINYYSCHGLGLGLWLLGLALFE